MGGMVGTSACLAAFRELAVNESLVLAMVGVFSFLFPFFVGSGAAAAGRAQHSTINGIASPDCLDVWRTNELQF